MESVRVMHVFGGHVRSGVESVVLDLADGLRAAGGHPILVPLTEGPFTQEARDLGFTVWPLGKKRRYDVVRIPALVRLIKRGEIDILHSHAVNGAFYACPAGRLAGIGTQVCSFHGDTAQHLQDVYRRSLPRVLSHRYFLALTRWCARLISPSHSLGRRLIEEGVPSDKVAFIPNGVDVSLYETVGKQREVVRAEFGVAPDEVLIGTLGRLAAVKNLPLFLEVAALLLSAHTQLKFVIAGDGTDRCALESMAARLGIASNIRFVGWRDDAPGFLAALDIFLVTSHSETGPLTSLGAMALGIPVVSTDVGVMEELDEYRGLGLVTPCREAKRMAEAVESLLADGAKAKRAGVLGKRIVVQRYTKALMVERTLDLYADMLGRRFGQAASAPGFSAGEVGR